MRRTSRWLVALATTVFMAASAGAAGLVKTDTVVGKGNEAVPGKTVEVHYTGWLHDPAAKDMRGKQFDSSRGRGPFSFPAGRRPGDQGLGRGRGRHEGRRQAHARHPARARLWRAGRRRGDSAERDAGFRGRAARCEVEGGNKRGNIAQAFLLRAHSSRTPWDTSTRSFSSTANGSQPVEGQDAAGGQPCDRQGDRPRGARRPARPRPRAGGGARRASRSGATWCPPSAARSCARPPR